MQRDYSILFRLSVFSFYSAVHSGIFQNGNNLCLVKLSAFKNVIKAFNDCGNVYTEKLGYAILCNPYVFIEHYDREARLIYKSYFFIAIARNVSCRSIKICLLG